MEIHHDSTSLAHNANNALKDGRSIQFLDKVPESIRQVVTAMGPGCLTVMKADFTGPADAIVLATRRG